jgi:hypothetical protein
MNKAKLKRKIESKNRNQVDLAKRKIDFENETWKESKTLLSFL